MAADFPEIRYRSPITLLGETSSLQPNIEMQWTMDIDTAQFTNAITLASLIRVTNETTGSNVELEYVDYSTRTRLLQLRPVTELDPSTTYTIFVNKEVLSTLGRKSKQAFYWQFQTAAGELGAVELAEPADFSVQEILPVFYWAPVSTGSVNYLIQIDQRWDFGSPIYQNTTTASSISPIAVFADNTTYYWRVRAYTASASGAWSDTRQFYYGTPRNAHATSKQDWYESDSFGLHKLGWENGLSNSAVFPTISLTFTTTPESNFESFISVWKKAQSPRNDDRTTYNESLVSGTWTQSASTITFTPSESISTNTRYEIRISPYLINTNGRELGTDYVLYFTSSYTPMYTDIRAIRSRFLGAEQHIPDDLINYWIYKRSLEAQARYYMYLQGQPLTLGDQPPESLIRDGVLLKSHGVSKWVEAATTMSVLQGILNESLRIVDTERKLGDYTAKMGPGFLKAIELAMQQANNDLDYWEDYLTVDGMSRVAVRSYNWTPMSRLSDLSVGHLEGRRGVDFE